MKIEFKPDELDVVEVRPRVPEWEHDPKWELVISSNSHDYTMEVVLPLSYELRVALKAIAESEEGGKG